MKHYTLSVLMLASPQIVLAAAPDDIKLEVSRDLCEDAGPNGKNFIVYATNSNANQTIDANFKYDSNPTRQHFVLFDANLNPMTDRFPKFHVRRLKPRESARIGRSKVRSRCFPRLVPVRVT